MDQDTGDISLNIFSTTDNSISRNKVPTRGTKKRTFDELTGEGLSSSTVNAKLFKKRKIDHPLSKQDRLQQKSKPQRADRSLDEDEDSGVDLNLEQGYKGGKKSFASAGKTSSLFGNNPEVPSFARRVVKPLVEAVFTSNSFQDLDIHPFTVSNLEQNLKVEKLTTIQQKTIPVILSGNDVLVRSQTGSGKTLAYAVPIVEGLQKIRPKLHRGAGIQAVIVVPTRELALQTYEWFVKLVKPFTWLVPGYLVGGEKRKSEKARLRKGITILIGTPGRILDHINNTKAMLMDRVRWLVLDEADRLLDMGYEKEVSNLVSAIDSQAEQNPDIFNRNEFDEPTITKRQTILVSATLTSAVERLAGLALSFPARVHAGDEGETQSQNTSEDRDLDLCIPESLMQFYMITPPKLRLVTLSGFIISKCQLSDKRKMLIFMATQDMVDYHTELLSSVLGGSGHDDEDDDDNEDGGVVDVEFFKLHGNMTQKDRTECFKRFRGAKSGVLICTDVAARGLDLPRVDWIVQYTAPCSVPDYVHRVGRTARVGVAGSALIFLTTTEVNFVRKLEDRRIRLQEEPMERSLQSLQVFNQPQGRGRNTNYNPSLEAAATALQLKYETAVLERRGLHGQAVKAYISFIRFYASYPKEGRDVFCFKNLHLGHFAKCFALRDPPTSIGGIGRRRGQAEATTSHVKRKYTAADPNRSRPQQPSQYKHINKTRELVTSEYSSGLPERKKKQKKKTED